MICYILNPVNSIIMLSFLHCSSCFAQVSVSVKSNSYTNCCKTFVLKNNSKDTTYAIMQSNSIYYWDTCFGYTAFMKPQIGYCVNVSNYYMDMDNYSRHRIILLPPDSTFTFGARNNGKIPNEELYLSMYVNPIKINEKDKIKRIRAWETTKMNKRKFVPGWEWRSIYANKEE